MCFIYAIWIWATRGGTIFIQLPKLHFVVMYNDQLVHGTTKNCNGTWCTESRSWDVYLEWLNKSGNDIYRVF